MNSEELLKNYKKIERTIKNNPPNLWVKFSVFKKQLDKKLIPETAETTPRKVSLYFNATTGEVGFSSNGEPYREFDWFIERLQYAHIPKEKDYIIISNWDVLGARNIDNLHFKGPAPWKVPYKAEYVFSLIINKNKEFISRPNDISFVNRKWETVKNPIIISDRRHCTRLSSSWNWHGISNIQNAFAEVFGVGLISGNTYIDFKDPTFYPKFLSHEEPVLRDTPKQRLVNSLTEITLKDPELTFDCSAKNNLICVASKVNDEYSALRWFIETANKKSYEISRLYVSKKSHIFCRKNADGQYIVLNNKLVSSAFDAQEVLIEKDAFLGTKLEYFQEIYEDISPELRSPVLYMLTVFPEFERMYKAGLKDICLQYLTRVYSISWTAHLTNEFGTVNTKEKSLNKMLGFNKHQLERIISFRNSKKNHSYYGIGHIMKKILTTDSCIDIDNKCFDAIMDALIELNFQPGLVDALKFTIETYSLKMCMNMIPTLKKIGPEIRTFENINRFGYTYRSTLSAIVVYADYVSMVSQLGESRRMRPHFDSFDEIKRMHDDAVAIINLKRDVIEIDKFNKRIDVWKKWEFDDDEKYEVIAPTKPEDIASEGIALRHCVKSYISRVAAGVTNILFIREKNDRETPFFTVQVSNAGTIEQVHGFGNRNVSTESGLDKFVAKWSKAKKLKINGYNKIR